MPSYLDFDATKNFRDYLLSKTLNSPNGPQTQSSQSYSVSALSDVANVDPGTVIDNRTTQLTNSSNSNTFKPLEYLVKEVFNDIPRRANLSLYFDGTPYFSFANHNLIGIMATDNFDTESELMKFAAQTIKTDPNGPVLSRIQQNLLTATVGKARILDAFNGNTSTAINILTGREPLIEKNYKITVAKTLLGKGIDFLETVAGVTAPFSEIPGDYLSNPANPINVRPEASGVGKLWQDVTGVIGSLVGIQRRPKATRKPSDLMIEYLSDGQKSALYHNLSFSKFAPNYTTSARSQQSTKLFQFGDKFAEGVKTLLGIEAPRGKAYIGDDRGNDVKFAMNDFNDRPIRSSYYLSLMFDPVAAQLFHTSKNVTQGGQISGKLTWISRSSGNKLGLYNAEYGSEQSNLLDSFSTGHTFADGSLLSKTQQLLDTLPRNIGEARSHVANVIDQTSRVFKDGDTMISRGSAVKYINKATGKEDGSEFCRVWTKDRAYFNYSDTMKTTGTIRKIGDSVMSKPWNLNIAPNSNGHGGFDGSTNIIDGQAKKYMFSIENLAWKSSNKPGFTYNDLPYCERGPNGGRVMWFPPYDLKVNENNNANWEENKFVGRPEPVYTYQNTTRSGTVSFKVVVDHPSILNLLIKDISDDQAEDFLNSFFAGCEDVDFYSLVRKYTTLDRSDLLLIIDYLEYYKDGKTFDEYDALKFTDIAGEQTTTPGRVIGGQDGQAGTTGFGNQFNDFLYFPNDVPSPSNDIYASTDYGKVYADYASTTAKAKFISGLSSALTTVLNNDTKKNKEDRKVLFGSETPTGTTVDLIAKKVDDINRGFTKLDANFTSLTGVTENIKKDLESNKVKTINLTIESSTSFVADDKYNIKLAYRRSDSIAKHVLKSITKTGSIPSYKWKKSVSDLNSNPGQESDEIIIKIKDLGYGDDREGDMVIKFTNLGEKATRQLDEKYDCHNIELNNTTGLKLYAPITFFCRAASVDLNYTLKAVDTPAKPGTKEPDTVTRTNDKTQITVDKVRKDRKPPLDVVKLLIMKTLSECFYFKQLEEKDPVVFTSLKEKLRYFHPAFHSMTPEGLNSRLTFLHQCLRPGDTIPIKGIASENNLDARNTTFGPPPVCVLRIGDFYHSKVVIKDLNITYDDSTWDLNPEGIGVQPMIANVTLQVNFIGGQGIKEPVARLQNALSSNFYANTEVYDYRATSTVDQKELQKTNIDFLEKLLGTIKTPTSPEAVLSPSSKIEGKYIGLLDKDESIYSLDMIAVTNTTNQYFNMFKDAYNKIYTTYGEDILPLFVSPTYRTINKFTVQTGMSSNKQVEILGNYPKGKEYSVLLDKFEKGIKDYSASANHNEILDFDFANGSSKADRSRKLIDPYIIDVVSKFMDTLRADKSMDSVQESRNKIIKAIDNLNFILVTNGTDGKLDGENISTIQLNDFQATDFYKYYSSGVDLIEKSNSIFTNELSGTFNFSDPSITLDNYKKVLAVILSQSGKVTEITKMYEASNDDKFFDKSTIHKIEKKVNKFIKHALPSAKKLKFKEASTTKTPYSKYGRYKVTIGGSLTSDQQATLKKIHNNKDGSSSTSLNFIK